MAGRPAAWHHSLENAFDGVHLRWTPTRSATYAVPEVICASKGACKVHRLMLGTPAMTIKCDKSAPA